MAQPPSKRQRLSEQIDDPRQPQQHETANSALPTPPSAGLPYPGYYNGPVKYESQQHINEDSRSPAIADRRALHQTPSDTRNNFFANGSSAAYASPTTNSRPHPAGHAAAPHAPLDGYADAAYRASTYMWTVGLQDMAQAVAALDEQTVRHLLGQHATYLPQVGDSVLSAYDQVYQAERSRTVTFEDQVNRVQRHLTEKHETLDESLVQELANKATETIRQVVPDIASRIGRVASYETKANAFTALRRIGMLVVDSEGVVPAEVHKQFENDRSLDIAMREVLRKMSLDERRLLRDGDKERFDRDIIELGRSKEALGTFDGLEDVKDLLGIVDERNSIDSTPGVGEQQAH